MGVAQTPSSGRIRGVSLPDRAVGFGAAEVGAGVLIAALMWIAFGRGPLNGDVMWALIWGKQLTEGVLPSYATDLASTPHPLATLLAAFASIFGRDAAYDVMVTIGYLSYGFLLAGTFRLGRVAHSWWVGLVAAGVMATSLSLLSYAAIGYLDVTAAALAVWAAALETERPRERVVLVLALLAVAGLQRPEMWALSGVYWLYLFKGLDVRARVGTAALVISAPFLWMLGDLIVTGNPLFSLHFTQQLIYSSRNHGKSTRHTTGGIFFDSLRSILRAPGVIGAVAGLVLAALLRRRSLYATIALAVVAGVAVELQARAGLVVLARFLFLTAAALAVLFGYATLGWITERARKYALVWAAAGLLILAVYGATALKHLSFQAHAPDRLAVPEKARAQLRSLALQPGTRATLLRCGHVITSQVLAPYLLYYLDEKPGYVVARPGPDVRSSVRARTSGATDFSGAIFFHPKLTGFHEVARNPSWALLVAPSCT
jgi:hypothetical protein